MAPPRLGRHPPTAITLLPGLSIGRQGAPPSPERDAIPLVPFEMLTHQIEHLGIVFDHQQLASPVGHRLPLA
jgi:hypothetical protein